MVQIFAFKILRITPKKNWVLWFIKCYKNKFKLSYLILADIAQKSANNLYQYKLFYRLLKEKIKKYKIKVYNIYNIDKKGFFIGVLNKTKKIYIKLEIV